MPVAHLEGTDAPSFPENEQGNKLKKDPTLPPFNGLKTKTGPLRFIFYFFLLNRRSCVKENTYLGVVHRCGWK